MPFDHKVKAVTLLQKKAVTLLHRSGNLSPIPKNILKLPFALTLSLPLPPFSLTLAWWREVDAVEDDRESECRRPWDLLV